MQLTDSDVDKVPETFSNYFISNMQYIQEGLLKHDSDGNTVTIDEMQTSLSLSKQCSSDPIPIWMLKEGVLNVLLVILCNIIND